jgi:hypothetical protein
VTPAQRARLHAVLSEVGIPSSDRAAKLCALSKLSSRPIASSNDLTDDEYDHAVKHFEAIRSWPPTEREMEVAILRTPDVDPWAKAS